MQYQNIQKIHPIPVYVSYLKYIFRHSYQVKKYLKYLKMQKIQPCCYVSVSYHFKSIFPNPAFSRDVSSERSVPLARRCALNLSVMAELTICWTSPCAQMVTAGKGTRSMGWVEIQ